MTRLLNRKKITAVVLPSVTIMRNGNWIAFGVTRSLLTCHNLVTIHHCIAFSVDVLSIPNCQTMQYLKVLMSDYHQSEVQMLGCHQVVWPFLLSQPRLSAVVIERLLLHSSCPSRCAMSWIHSHCSNQMWSALRYIHSWGPPLILFAVLRLCRSRETTRLLDNRTCIHAFQPTDDVSLSSYE